MLASTILLASSVGSTPTKVAVTPWCDNSMRVRISPASLPPAAAARAAELAASLKKKGMTDLAGAIYEEGTCASSSSSHPIAAPKGSRTEHGNLAASVQSDGSIAFSRVDTRDVLFTAVATFTLNAPPAVAADDDDASHGWTTLSDKMGTPSCSGGEFDGSLGSAESPAECLALIVASPLLPRINYGVWNPSNKGCYVCDLSDRGDSSTWTYKDVKGAASFVGPKLAPPGLGFYSANLTLTAGPAATDEIIYGLGQGNWTDEGGCPAPGLAGSRIVPLERNGQTVNLQQRKFHVSIPFTYSTAGYGFLFNMPGHGDVTIGAHGVGGSKWSQRAALYLDFWVSALPKSVAAKGASPTAIYTQYADATGHSPPLREDAMVFWQSRNRYKSSAIALSIAQRYDALGLDVGVLVIDYKNQLHDGDFAPNPACFPSVKALADGVHAAKIPTLMFSFWPEVKAASAEYTLLSQAGCLINPDLDGLAFDATIPECRALVWDKMLKPRYYDQGVNAYWLDETDGEGTGGGGDGDYGYNTSYGDALAYSNLWVNDWLSMYSDPVAKLNEHLPLVLTRGTWAGGQRHGIVLWSSDIHSSFEQLASQVPQGVHASMSGIPWWTTDVGGYGCGESRDPTDPYMQELIVRWYQFGAFSPVFRTHGCRSGPSEPDTATCKPAQGSCGFNEIWSYGNATQVMLEKMVIFRSKVLKPYIQELDKNVTKFGVPTMRPLAYEFPNDSGCRHINDQYMLGPRYLVAPVTVQNATSRKMYFPKGVNWKHLWSAQVVTGGQTLTVNAPLDQIPVYERQ